MKAIQPHEALRQHRSRLIVRWAQQLGRIRTRGGQQSVRIDPRLLGGLFDEAVTLMGSGAESRIPRLHSGSAFEALAPFPQSASICIDVLEAGAQVAAAFVAENAGNARAWWTTAARDRTLREIDSIFHILVHREIQSLCDYCLHRQAEAGAWLGTAHPAASFTSTPEVLSN